MVAPTGSNDAKAIELLEGVIALQMALHTELLSLPSGGKTAIWLKLLDFAKRIAQNSKCPTGEILWGQSIPVSIGRNDVILASIGSELDGIRASLDYAAHSALFVLNAMALISRAQALAEHPRLTSQTRCVRMALGELIDEIMEQ
jgi:hypothetical protein